MTKAQFLQHLNESAVTEELKESLRALVPADMAEDSELPAEISAKAQDMISERVQSVVSEVQAVEESFAASDFEEEMEGIAKDADSAARELDSRIDVADAQSIKEEILS